LAREKRKRRREENKRLWGEPTNYTNFKKGKKKEARKER
jgi:hypothetical protein